MELYDEDDLVSQRAKDAAYIVLGCLACAGIIVAFVIVSHLISRWG